MPRLSPFGLAAFFSLSFAACAQTATTPAATPVPASQTPASQTPASQTPSGQTAPAPSAKPAATPASTSDAATPPDTAADNRRVLTVPDSAIPSEDSKRSTDSKGSPDSKSSASSNTVASAKKTDSIPSPGEDLNPHIKAGSEDDVNAIGTRNIGGRGMGNWYSTDWEIRVGKQYSMEIEKSAHLVTDPVIVEYVNRIGQNLVKNSDAKVPFTIKVIDSDEINAMALPGGFFYVNSGLIMNCDEEAELAGVMAHEISHVVAHHAARQQTKMNYAQIASIPLMIMTEGTWTGYGIYEATQLAIPMSFLKFSRMDEAEADYLGVQYMYKAGYDPQSFITLFEKLDALEKHKPGTLAKAFSDHPQTPDRIAHSEDEIATILPAKPDYVVTTSEFDDVKGRLARIENKRKINGKDGGNKPTLRRAGASSTDPNNPNTGSDQPTLGRRN
jgi:beta-barrel assembly-enhancing protease